MENKKSITIILAILIIGVGIFFLPKKVAENGHVTPTDLMNENTGTTSDSIHIPTGATSTAPKVTTTPKTTTNTSSTQSPTSIKPPVSGTVSTAGKTAPEISLPSGFTNTNAVQMRDFTGKQVVLVNFWTTSSINSVRTIPYLNQLHQKYKHKGLVVLSIHTPQFVFEREKDNVDKVALAHNIQYPIVLDNQYGTWNAWGNKNWPAQYLVNLDGRIVYTHSGEGDYQTIETKIQEQLSIRSAKLKLPAEVYVPFTTPTDAIPLDSTKILSNQTYFGASRNSSLANGVTGKVGMQDMNTFTEIAKNRLYLTGPWEFTSEVAKSAIENNKITFKYNAKNVYAVLGALNQSRILVTIDGAPLTTTQAGGDIRIENGQSYLYVTNKRIYDIVRGAGYGEYTLELNIETSGLEAYVLMFG